MVLELFEEKKYRRYKRSCNNKKPKTIATIKDIKVDGGKK